jgi:hypothetical protein
VVLACLQVTRLIRRKVLFEDDIAKALQVRTHLVTSSSPQPGR